MFHSHDGHPHIPSLLAATIIAKYMPWKYLTLFKAFRYKYRVEQWILTSCCIMTFAVPCCTCIPSAQECDINSLNKAGWLIWIDYNGFELCKM